MCYEKSSFAIIGLSIQYSRTKFKQICVEFEISDKVAFIISDNAGNMRKAFEVRFMVDSEGITDDEEIWCVELISPDVL